MYSYRDEETTYFGCLHKVFAPELDLAAFVDETGQVNRRADPYGSIRATREPRVHCPVSVERAYEGDYAAQCRNPGFLHGYFPERGRDRPLDAKPRGAMDHDLPN